MGAAASTAGTLDSAEVEQVESLRWLRLLPESRLGDESLRVYICADADYDELTLTGLSLESLDDGGAPLSRALSAGLGPGQIPEQPALARLRSERRTEAAAHAIGGDDGGARWEGRADVPLQELASKCWWTAMPQPVTGSETALWSAGGSFDGRALLRFRVRLDGAELEKDFEVEVEPAARCSMCCFVVVKSERSVALLRGTPGDNVGAEEAAQTYRTFVGGLWRQFTEPRLDNSDGWTAAWEHGLLLAFMLRRGRPPHAELGQPIVATAFRPALAVAALHDLLPERWDARDRIQLWVFAGQALATAREMLEPETAFDVTEHMWQLYALPRFEGEHGRQLLLKPWIDALAQPASRNPELPTETAKQAMIELLIQHHQPTTPEGVADLHEQLSPLNLGDLRKRAAADKVDDAQVRAALDPVNFMVESLPAGLLQTRAMAAFVRDGLRALYDADCAAAQPSYGWIRALPLMVDFGVVPKATAVATASGRAFKLPDLLEIEQPGGTALPEPSAGMALARSASVRADETPLEQTLLRARALALRCECASEQHQPLFESLRAELTSIPDNPETTRETAALVQQAEGDMEEVGRHGRQLRARLQEFDATMLPIRDQRLALLQRVGAGFSKSGRGPRVSTMAGSGERGHADGPAMEAVIQLPEGILSMPDGSLLFTDRTHCLRRLSEDFARVETLGGLKGSGNTNGAVASARFSSPKGLCLVGDDVFIADSGNHCIRKLSADGVVSTVAGSTAGRSGFRDGKKGALFHSPYGIAARPNGALVVADKLNRCLRVVRPHDGRSVVLAGIPQVAGAHDGAARFDAKGQSADPSNRQAYLVAPTALTVLSDGAVLFCDGHGIRLLASGNVQTIAGQLEASGCADGKGPNALFKNPSGLVERAPGVVVVADKGNHRICELDLATRVVVTVAGSGKEGWQDGDVESAQFDGPTALCLLPDQTVAVADSFGNRVRRLISPDCDDLARDEYETLTSELSVGSAELGPLIASASAPLAAATSLIEECAARVRHASQRSLSASFRHQANRTIAACHARTVSEEEIVGLVMAAPSLSDLGKVIEALRALPKPFASTFKDALQIRLSQSTNWDLMSVAQAAAEVTALQDIVQVAPFLIAGSVALAFSNKSFRIRFPEPCPTTLALLEVALGGLTGTRGLTHNATADDVEELERAARTWLAGLTPTFMEEVDGPNHKKVMQRRPAEDVVLEVFENWVPIVSRWDGTFTQAEPWLAASHIGGVCGTREMGVLRALDSLVLSTRGLSLLEGVLRQVLAKVAEASRPADVMKDIDLSEVGPHLHLELVLQLLVTILQRVIPVPRAETEWEKDYSDTERRNQATTPQLVHWLEVAAMAQLLPHQDVWRRFLCWFANARAVLPLDDGALNHTPWQTVATMGSIAAHHFAAGFEQLEAGALTLRETKSALKDAEKDLVPLFEALGLTDPALLVVEVREEIAGGLLEMDQIKTIVKRLLPDSQELREVERISEWFEQLTVQQMQWLLGRADDPGLPIPRKMWHPPLVDAPQPIAAPLVSCTDWILHQDLLRSSLFRFVWDSLPPGRSSESVLDAARLLNRLASSIDDRTISFGELRQLASVLDLSNLERLSSSRHGVSASLWEAVPPDPGWVDETAQLLSEWRHVRDVCDNAKPVHDILRMLGGFGNRKCKDEIAMIHQSVETLEATALPNFDARRLSECVTVSGVGTAASPSLSRVAATVDPSLPAMNVDLVSIVTGETLDLIDWLRSEFANDRDFTSAIEIAVGRTEMECPAELWEEGDPGRVAEEKLSQLATVRSFLHPLAYRLHDTFGSVGDLLACVASIDLERTDEKIMSMIQDTNALLIPLTELLSDQSDTSASNRLVQMMLPDRNATWECEARLAQHEAAASNLALTFVVPRATRTFEKKLLLPEILDWQSQIVLSSRSGQISEEAAAVIQAFVKSLDWAKELNSLLLQLHLAGHFDYQQGWIERHAVTDPEALRGVVVRLRETLSSWRLAVREVRESSYFINFYSCRQVWLMVQYLHSSSHEQYGDELLQILQATVTERQGDKDGATALLGRMRECFSAPASASPAQLLAACGAALDETLRSSLPRHRPTGNEPLEAIPADALKGGVSVICSPHVIEHTVSAFLRAGSLPERECLVFCHDTPIETLTNLVLRWSGSETEGRCPLYVIANADSLPLEQQAQLSAEIRDATSVKTRLVPLLLICTSETSFVVSQFEAQRLQLRPLPGDALRRIGKCVSDASDPAGSDSAGVCVYNGDAGSGKTFAVRAQCAQSRLQHVHVPVNGGLSAAQLLARIESQTAATNKAGKVRGTMLHLDLSSSVRTEFDYALFELTIVGSLVDPVSGRAFSWRPSETYIAVEVASGALVRQLQTCAVLDARTVLAGPRTFVTDRPSLFVGMGSAFTNAQFDGCVTDAGGAGEDAHGRLTFVVKALRQHKEMGGCFPPLFDPAAVGMCSSEDAYALLVAASQMNGRPSLWCVWSFVNVMYWQLREMSHPEGPIHGAVMPDPKAQNAELDLSIKQQIKGQLITFAARTATEFATRQTNKAPPDTIVGVNLGGKTRAEFNGRWTKMSYLNDGEPVFQCQPYRGEFFLYFRSRQNKGRGGWVIDDVIVPSGSVYSSSDGPQIDSVWTTIPLYQPDNSFKLRPVKGAEAKAAHRGEGIHVSGSREPDENGLYLRQPPYDNIGGEPHYIKQKGGTRKHLFWDNPDNQWVICPQCNTDEGTDAMSEGSNILGTWYTMPPKQLERHGEVTFVFESGAEVSAAKMREAEPEPEPEPEPELEMQAHMAEPEPEPDGGDADLHATHTLKAWGDSNHEAMLFSNESHTVTFLSSDPKKMKQAMHPNLVSHLETNKISVGEGLDSLNGRFTEILGALTNIKRSAAKAAQLLPDYQLTGDALLKMLAIYVRVRCGIPVILMGECGCGKTYLISYLCLWLGSPLVTLDVHGGTTEADILATFDEAVEHLQKSKTEVFVFLDEVNTCAHMGIITEAICSRSLNGRALPAGVKVLAAVNPHRRRSVQEESEGLVFNLGQEQEFDPMAALVYRVHPVPLTLEGFVFDFGALSPTQENLYVHGMVKSCVADADDDDLRAIVVAIGAAQKFCRTAVGDASAVSLRDVKRCLRLLNWFLALPPRTFAKPDEEQASSAKAVGDGALPEPPTKPRTHDGPKAAAKRTLAVATTLALAHVYYYRHGKAEHRASFWHSVGWELQGQLGRDMERSCFRKGAAEWTGSKWRQPDFSFSEIVQAAQDRWCSRIEVESGIAMNEALSENLFVMTVCVRTTTSLCAGQSSDGASVVRRSSIVSRSSSLASLGLPKRSRCRSLRTISTASSLGTISGGGSPRSTLSSSSAARLARRGPSRRSFRWRAPSRRMRRTPSASCSSTRSG